MAAASCSLLCCLLLAAIGRLQTARATSLREVFYNELRSMLHQNALPQVPENGEPSRPVEKEGWAPRGVTQLGQISGVAVNNVGQPVIFHRGTRIWDYSSFNASNHFQLIAEGPIPVDTVVTLDPTSGQLLSSWGVDMFYLPHGITIDPEGNIWLTDVAMHQVFKFSPGSRRPSLILGQQFRPGQSKMQFCKPTSVAVATTGEVFVADGYCNTRILKFDRHGSLMRVFPQQQEFLSLMVPHSLALLEPRDLLCVADRENMRVVCIDARLHSGSHGTHTLKNIQQPDMGRVFAIAALGDLVYAVNGPTFSQIPVQGLTLDPMSETIIDHWGPKDKDHMRFSNPHDIAISPDGSSLYVSEIGPNKLWKFDLRVD